MIESEVWAPWQPKVGDRVRVRLSGECRIECLPLSPQGMAGLLGHPNTVNGQVGTIIAGELAYYVHRGHPYKVQFDDPFQWNGRAWPSTHLAAVELEPLEEQP